MTAVKQMQKPKPKPKYEDIIYQYNSSIKFCISSEKNREWMLLNNSDGGSGDRDSRTEDFLADADARPTRQPTFLLITITDQFCCEILRMSEKKTTKLSQREINCE